MANDDSSSISNPHEPSKPFTCITLNVLASLGSSISVEDMTDHVLRGLDDGYRVVIDSVNARDIAIIFYDLLEKLLI
ncbi:uncharacterized protein HKW66_Vig0042590 [Vigna angularis]|uniref:Uncharacterized protein n=1 Tax=Phaseolus angularis TaxID=3914 RepID=A0A8T0KZ90_PHAAN|nr:uncharacterized protein HKW66_Vig0042590 [Vigna angularis]